MRSGTTVLVTFLLALLSAAALADDGAARPQTVEEAYPGLVGGSLASAAIGELPPGILLDMGEEEVTEQQLDEVLAGSVENMREQLRKNSLLLVQEMATKGLLLRAARLWAEEKGRDEADKGEAGVIAADEGEADVIPADEGEADVIPADEAGADVIPAAEAEARLIGDHLQAVVADVTVTDAEVEQFYEDNQDMFGGAQLEDVRDLLRQFVLRGKRQEKADAYVRTLASRFGVVISGAWLAEQAVLVRDNPVDKARAGGLPTMVDFGADGCRPCDMMAPILETLGKDYAGRANVLFVHVREDPVLAARFAIQSIPTQVFFDRDGKEVSRHTGFLAQDKIEQKLAELGAK